ncbi:MAG: DUF2199 domain-containing protein [Thermoanaerobaculia bacterium]
MKTWQCSVCGGKHDSFPLSYSWGRPYDYFTLPPEQRAKFVALDGDSCHIEDELHYLRANLELRVIGTDETLLLGVWIGVSKENFYRYREFLANEATEPDPPSLPGAFSGVLPGFDPDELLWSEVRLRIRRGGLVPSVEIDDPDHPLFEARASGVSQEYCHRFVRELRPELAGEFGA